MPPVSLSERSRDRRRSSRPSRAFGRPEARARYRRSAALGDRHTPRVDVDREVGTHSIALLTMRAPNARTGAAAHMYMMFFAVVGSIFVCRRPMDARGRVRSRRAQARQLRKNTRDSSTTTGYVELPSVPHAGGCLVNFYQQLSATPSSCGARRRPAAPAPAPPWRPTSRLAPARAVARLDAVALVAHVQPPVDLLADLPRGGDRRLLHIRRRLG